MAPMIMDDMMSMSGISGISLGATETVLDIEEADAVVKRALLADKREVLSLCKVTRDELATVSKQQSTRVRHYEAVLQSGHARLQAFLPKLSETSTAPAPKSCTPELEHLAVIFVERFASYRRRAELVPQALLIVKEILPNVDSATELLHDYFLKVNHVEAAVARRMQTYKERLAEAGNGITAAQDVQPAACNACPADTLPSSGQLHSDTVWGHDYRAQVRGHVSDVLRTSRDTKAIAAALGTVTEDLHGLIRAVSAELKVVDTAAELPISLRDEVELVSLANASKLETLFAHYSDLKLRSATDHAILMEVSERGTSVVRHEHAQYTDWYAQQNDALSELRGKIRKVEQELRDVPLSCERQRAQRLQTIAACEEEKRQTHEAALRSIAPALQECDKRIAQQRSDITALEATTQALVDEAQGNLAALQAEERALCSKIETEGTERTRVFEKMRKNIKAIRDISQSRCEELEMLHRTCSTAVDMSGFCDSLLQHCVATADRERTAAEKVRDRRLAGLHELLLNAVERRVFASSRAVHAHREAVRRMDALEPVLSEAQRFFAATCDPLADQHKQATLLLAASRRDLASATAQHEGLADECAALADPSIAFLNASRRQFTRPVAAAAAESVPPSRQPVPPAQPRCRKGGSVSTGPPAAQEAGVGGCPAGP